MFLWLSVVSIICLVSTKTGLLEQVDQLVNERDELALEVSNLQDISFSMNFG